MVPFALEVEHRIDHVLHDPRAGNSAFLGDVTDDQNRKVVRFGQTHQLRGAFAYLVDAAWRRRSAFREHGLNRVDDENTRPERFSLSADVRHGGFGQYVDLVVLQAETFGMHAELTGRFFPRYVESRRAVTPVSPAEAMGGLQKQS